MKRAFIIGIDGYASVRSLRTAVSDATALAKLLEDQHGYSVILLCDGEATLAGIRAAFGQLAATVVHGDRLLFYFAGHVLATAGDEGPDGSPKRGRAEATPMPLRPTKRWSMKRWATTEPGAGVTVRTDAAGIRASEHHGRTAALECVPWYSVLPATLKSVPSFRCVR
jgi:hypothetical protein